ncbi:TRIO salivary gland protein precursor [Anopheles sinensis]|uniref:TRIO salivary gland protein n=1 Tax=Anopheles sinensis TaxID=74873 RepID=A0A084W249_ANOSI|nr:TRIO salivary gland protein precursor [Anopheles sinensis]
MDHRFCAFLILSVLLCVPFAHGAGKPSTEPHVCGKPLSEIKNQVGAWVTRAEKCRPWARCADSAHVSQYKQGRAVCGKIEAKQQEKTLESLLPGVVSALSAMEKLYDPFKADIGKIVQEFERQLESIWTASEELQLEMLYASIGSGRVEKALHYRSIIGDHITDLTKTQFTAANAEELLQYAWNLTPWPERQKNTYKAIGEMVRSSENPLLQTAYAIDRANVNLPEDENSDQETYSKSMERLRANLTSGHLDTLLELARRYPPRYAYVRDNLGKLFGDRKPNPAELVAIVSTFPRELPTADERLLTLKAIAQQYLTDNATITAEPAYLYPMTVLAHELATSISDQADQSTADDAGETKTLPSSLADMFNTPISGRSVEYFSQSLASKTSG